MLVDTPLVEGRSNESRSPSTASRIVLDYARKTAQKLLVVLVLEELDLEAWAVVDFPFEGTDISSE